MAIKRVAFVGLVRGVVTAANLNYLKETLFYDDQGGIKDWSLESVASEWSSESDADGGLRDFQTFSKKDASRTNDWMEAFVNNTNSIRSDRTSFRTDPLWNETKPNGTQQAEPDHSSRHLAETDPSTVLAFGFPCRAVSFLTQDAAKSMGNAEKQTGDDEEEGKYGNGLAEINKIICIKEMLFEWVSDDELKAANKRSLEKGGFRTYFSYIFVLELVVVSVAIWVFRDLCKDTRLPISVDTMMAIVYALFHLDCMWLVRDGIVYHIFGRQITYLMEQYWFQMLYIFLMVIFPILTRKSNNYFFHDFGYAMIFIAHILKPMQVLGQSILVGKYYQGHYFLVIQAMVRDSETYLLNARFYFLVMLFFTATMATGFVGEFYLRRRIIREWFTIFIAIASFMCALRGMFSDLSHFEQWDDTLYPMPEEFNTGIFSQYYKVATDAQKLEESVYIPRVWKTTDQEYQIEYTEDDDAWTIEGVMASSIWNPMQAEYRFTEPLEFLNQGLDRYDFLSGIHCHSWMRHFGALQHYLSACIVAPTRENKCPVMSNSEEENEEFRTELINSVGMVKQSLSVSFDGNPTIIRNPFVFIFCFLYGVPIALASILVIFRMRQVKERYAREKKQRKLVISSDPFDSDEM